MKQNSEAQPLLLICPLLKALSYAAQGQRVAEPLGIRRIQTESWLLLFPIFQTSLSGKTPDAITFL